MYFHVCMYFFRVASPSLANIRANGSFWNWRLSDAFLVLVSVLCFPCSYFSLFQTCIIHSLESNSFGLLTHCEAAHTCCLAVGKSSQGYLFYKESEGGLLLLYPLKGRVVSNLRWCSAIFFC